MKYTLKAMSKTCCAVGCSNHSMMKRKLSFCVFPKESVRREMWINAVKRINVDGSKWRPTSKNALLCGEHFLIGKLVDL